MTRLRARGWPGAAPRGFVRQVGERVRIDRIAAGGDGVGRLADGRAVFVPRTAPGDEVDIALTRTAARFARGRVLQVLVPGPGRVDPVCPHYTRDRCGGCQLQHLGVEAQREARRSIAGDAIRRIAKLPLEADPTLEPAESAWGYRAKITLACAVDGKTGYHPLDGGPVFELEACPIAAPALNAVWQRVRTARRLWPRTLERLVLRLDREAGLHLVFETGEGPIWTEGPALHRAVADQTALTVWWRPAGGAARAMAGAASAYPATAFEQVNPAMGDRVRTRAIEGLGPVAGRRVWDLYAGIGETSSRLAEAGATVQSVEWDRGAVAAAEEAQRPYGARIERVTGPAEAVVRSLGAPDLVITNPPRTGMDRDVVMELVRRHPERIVYVSCDPATLARDLGWLAGGAGGTATYRLAALDAFDLFPQTAHIESVAVLERA